MSNEGCKIDFPEAVVRTKGGVASLSLEMNESAPVAQRKFVTTVISDEQGEVLFATTKAQKRMNGSGFVISYTEKMSDFLVKVTTGSIVRVFLYIAHHQNYGTDGKTFGYRCSHKYLWQVLRMDRTTLWDALSYLKANFLVHVGKIEGYTEFMVNPDYVTIGTDKKTRREEWNRRWAETFRQG